MPPSTSNPIPTEEEAWRKIQELTEMFKKATQELDESESSALSQQDKDDINAHLERLERYERMTDGKTYPTKELGEVAVRKRRMTQRHAQPMRDALSLDSREPMKPAREAASTIALDALDYEAAERQAWLSYIREPTECDSAVQMESRAREYVKAKQEDLIAESVPLGPTSDRDITLFMHELDEKNASESVALKVISSLLTGNAKPVSVYLEENEKCKSAAESFLAGQSTAPSDEDLAELAALAALAEVAESFANMASTDGCRTQ